MVSKRLIFLTGLRVARYFDRVTTMLTKGRTGTHKKESRFVLIDAKSHYLVHHCSILSIATVISDLDVLGDIRA